MQSGSLSPIMERHTPQHPLPDEIQKMGEEGTVCQFCGVSYLIHREIKKLEDRIEELEKETEKGRKALRNELILKEELQSYVKKSEILTSRLNEKDLELQEAKQDIENLSINFDEARRNIEQLKDQNEKLKFESLHRKKQMKNAIECSLKSVRQTKTELLDIKCQVEPIRTQIQHDIDNMNKNILDILSKFKAENDANSREVQLLQEELTSGKKNVELLQATVKLMENELKTMATEKDKICDELKTENKHLQEQSMIFQSRNAELLQDIAKLQSQLGLSKSDSAQISEALGLKKQELQSTLQKLHKLEKESEVTIRRLNQEIKILENDIRVIQNEKLKWKEVERNLLMQKEKLQTLVNSTYGENKPVAEQIENLKKELESIKTERGQMITSHQNQISQLKETFKEKLKKANGDPEAMEEKIRILKQSHRHEMIELESHLKERHDIELSLEREKHEEELKAYNQRHKESSENDALEWKRQAEILFNNLTVSNNKIDALRSEYSEIIDENQREKTEFKDVIAKLEKKIIDLTSEHDNTAIDIQIELKDTKRKLSEAMEEKDKMEHRSMMLTKEVCVLQETVRRECEERFELTEALSQVQEQVKIGGTTKSVPLRTPVSAINKVHRQSSIPSHETNGVSQRNGLHRHSSGASLESMTDAKNVDLSPHVKDIMFSNKNTSIIRNMSDAKSEELAEIARRRIAAAIKRK